MARDTSNVPAFGQAASDYVPSEDGDVWMRTFKQPMTLIRICPAERVNERGEKVYGADAWPTEREHYVDNLGSFPCSQRFGMECPGCNDPSEKVRSKRRQYYINALDDQGELRVFKFGVKLFQTLQARQERAIARNPDNKQPLSDLDYMINRMKTGSKSTDVAYDPEPGDKYEVEWPTELHDIDQLLKEQYAAALEYYAGEDGGQPTPAADDDTNDDQGAEKAPASRIPAKKAAAAPAKESEPEKSAPEAEAKSDPADKYGPLGATPSEADIEDATSADLKQFLTGRGVEFPQRAARSRLEDDAKKVAAEPPY